MGKRVRGGIFIQIFIKIIDIIIKINCNGTYKVFFASRGALRNHSPSALTLPSSGKPLPFFDFRRGMGMDLGSKLAESLWGSTRI